MFTNTADRERERERLASATEMSVDRTDAGGVVLNRTKLWTEMHPLVLSFSLDPENFKKS